jgi:CRISPR-associated endonuclease Csn1
VTDRFSADELLRVADEQIYLRLSDLANDDGSLWADPGRGFVPTLPERVELFPSNAAYIRVRHGAAPIGVTATTARIYAWRSNQGFRYGVVRMYAGEAPRIGFATPGVDVMTHELPLWSQAIRTANKTLRAKIVAGEARRIGWIAVNDELELDTKALSVRAGSGKIVDFLSKLPERRWVVTGFFSADTLSIAPSYLAAEGIDENTEPAVARVLRENRVRLAVNLVLGAPGATIIRRTALGRPRWRQDGLPASLRLAAAAEDAFAR